MLKAIYPTEALKLGRIAATYRAGSESIFSTCPATCSLLPKPKEGTDKLDIPYLELELKAVPRKGIAWSYTHFHPNQLPTYDYPIQSITNFSTDHLTDAVYFSKQGLPTVYAAPANDTDWPRRIQGTRFIRCPAELHSSITCQTCGGGKPLCARKNRDYVIVFVGHGTAKKHVGTDKPGGCYAATGNCAVQWNSTMNGIGPTTWNETNDPDRLLAWVRALPIGTLLRHRISGDLGLDKKIIPIRTLQC